MARAAILAIGTELTSGQITNRNATWISERLGSLGLRVHRHEVVPDDHDLILGALDHCAADAEVLVVTGGLGPTTDDFTRDVLAAWAGSELQFREASWTKIETRLRARGIEVAESNRRQCFFPLDATVLANGEGTADGYRFLKDGTHVLVLPGPPREGMHIWDTHVRPFLAAEFATLVPERLLIWKTLGKSESALGEIVEAAVAGAGLTTGYRASPPYVEVKIWVPQGLVESKVDAALARLESGISTYTVARGEEDLAENWLNSVRAKTGTLGVMVLDLGTEGALTERITGILKAKDARDVAARLEIMTRFHDGSSPDQLPDSANEWIFALFPQGEAVVLGPEGRWRKTIAAPFKAGPTERSMLDRYQRFFTERALEFYAQTLALRSR